VIKREKNWKAPKTGENLIISIPFYFLRTKSHPQKAPMTFHSARTSIPDVMEAWCELGTLKLNHQGIV
jgi:hypothetical protein